MSTVPPVTVLIARWQQQQAQGNTLSLQELCADCPERVDELKQHLEAVASMESFLNLTGPEGGPRIGTLLHISRTQPDAELDGQSTARPLHIAGYEILGELGRGGMGVVYKARQTKLNRVVALKMILAGGHAGSAELARFQTEGEAIARLQHANIVQVHEVGEHEGKPFFSLEYCGRGSLEKKLNSTPLPSREAATLVETLARAMQAAHDQHIIHRDLKPANVLLTEDGTPKITDFGLAKKLDEVGQTHSGAIMGTPSYMAPEQANGEGHEVGPGADIYALGGILYECLTGRPPFKAATLVDTLVQVRVDEPVPPRQLQSRTPRDLETICLKCLHKEPKKRYATAMELAQDLRRFLDGQPILARSIGRLERTWRWGRRNPRIAGLLGLMAVLILTALSSVTFLWRQADDERGRAQRNEADARRQEQLANKERLRAEKNATEAEHQKSEAKEQAAKAQQVAEFLSGIFEANDPLGLSGYGSIIPKATGETLTVRELLDRGAARIDTGALQDAKTRAFLKDRIGNAYLNLSELERAEPLLREAFALRSDALGANHPDTAASLHSLARLAHVRGRYFEAEELYRQALAARLQLTPLPERELADTEFNLAWLLTEMEDFEPAVTLFQQALERRIRIFGPRDREVALVRVGLASIYVQRQDQLLKAVKEVSEARAILLDQEGTGKLAEAVSLFQDAVIASEGTGNLIEAEKKLQQCLTITRQNLPARHLYLTFPLFQLGETQMRLKKYEESERHLRECLDIARVQVGLTHPKTALVVSALTNLYRLRNRQADATKLMNEFLAAHRAKPGPFLADALTIHAYFLFLEGDHNGERKELEEALALFRAEPRTPHRMEYLSCLISLSWNYFRSGRHTDAERLAADNVPLVRTRYGARSSSTAIVLTQLATIQLAQRNTGPEVEKELIEARSILRPLIPSLKPPAELATVYLNLSVLYRLRDRPHEAYESARAARGIVHEAGEFITLAREFAWCSSDLLRLYSSPTPEQLAESRRAADEAVAALQEAVKCGFRNTALLRAEKAFDPLREREDFKALLVTIEKP